MKVMHLYSNWKWTGPAEPAVLLASELKKRGHDVLFASGISHRGMRNLINDKARERGLEPIDGLFLTKHFRPVKFWHDVRKLAEILRQERPDIVHTHLQNDHLLAGWAVRRAKVGTRIVRTSYDGVTLPSTFRNRLLLKKFTDGLVVVSNRAREGIIRKFGFPAGRVWKVDTAVDFMRFDPSRELPDMREKFGIGRDAFVVGLVARIQPRRRFDVFWEAVRLLVKEKPHARVLLVGRGTREREVAREPVGRMGLGTHVTFAGYLEGDEYVGALAAMDVLVFLVPGTDGSCRAVREAMAMGRPVVGTRLGMLPELLGEGTGGILVDGTSGGLFRALSVLASDGGLINRLSSMALEFARRDFCVEKQVAQTEAIYNILGMV